MTVDRRHTARGWLSICIVILTGALLSCGAHWNREASAPALPCGLNGVNLGMTQKDLLKIRPEAIPDTSTPGFVEQLSNCLPFIEKAEYHFESGRLNQILLGRNWQLNDDPHELPRILPGLLAGSRRLWGQPSQEGVFSKPYGKDTIFWFAAFVWTKDPTRVILRYTPSQTIEDAVATGNHAVPISIIIFVSSGRAAQEAIAWLNLETVGEHAKRLRPDVGGAFIPNDSILH